MSTQPIQDIGPMLAHSLRRCANTKPTLGQHFLLAVIPNKHETLAQCWVNVGPTFRVFWVGPVFIFSGLCVDNAWSCTFPIDNKTVRSAANRLAPTAISA